MNNTFCIIRSIGERTTSLAAKLYRDAGIAEVIILNNRGYPFVSVLKKSYEEALARANDYKWVIIVDADVIPGKKFKKNMERALDKFENDESVFEFVHYTHDKLLNRFVPEVCGGIRVYRIDFLEYFFSKINPSLERPELEINKLSRQEGYKVFILKDDFYLAGYHCYEQFYGDLYDKTYFRTLKWVEPYLRKIQNNAEQMFRDYLKYDRDFAVCLKAIEDAKQRIEYVEKQVPSDALTYNFYRVKGDFEFEEKEDIDIESFDIGKLPDLGELLRNGVVDFPRRELMDKYRYRMYTFS